ncbi:putative vacuolar H+ Ca2+ [Rosellinia necatrix]|uniref:Putative vacuolar H+ Ca2 n=1 Tax=Rosellinia necatrix TaxID=77044 RepID=A0A1W2TI26_ROSNE|nr:putative vacuolar H+ Ca2+ [Rosellinia necatrix]
MSNRAQDTRELKLPSPEQLNGLREELRLVSHKATAHGLGDQIIETIFHLPPSELYEAVRSVALTFGPFSSLPAAEYPSIATTIPHDDLKFKQPSPIVDDGESFLEYALAALTSYNELLEEKVAKFSIQSVRSLATIRESSDSAHDLTVIEERTTEAKLRKLLHMQQIAILREKFDYQDKNRSLKLEEYIELFRNETLFLNCYDRFLDDTYRPEPVPASPDGLWAEYDHVLQQIERWKDLIDFEEKGGEATEAIINRARQHVSQLVYSITRHCQVQLATVFHESLVANTKRSSHHKAVHDEAADIIKEIDWLWEEVIPVAHMSVSAQYLNPVLQHFKEWEDTKRFREAIMTTYSAGVLRFMNDRLSAVAERTQILIYHHQALNNVSWIRQLQEASSPTDLVPARMPHTLAQNVQPRRDHATAPENLQAFMRMYGAVPVQVDDPFPKATPSLLDEYVQSRAHKGDTLLQDLHKLFEAATKSGLTDKELGGELLLDSLLADSAATPLQPGSVYKDAQLEGSIAMLRDQANQVQEMFKDLKLEGPASAPDYVAHAYRQTADRLAAKVGESCFRDGENPNPACMTCIRCLKFEEFVRKWGC